MASVTEVVEIPVAGMTCDHCVGTVRRALEAVPGVRSADVDLPGGRAEVTIDPERVDRAGLKPAVEAAGYSVPDGTSAPPSPSASKLVTIGPMPTPAPRSDRPEEWNLADRRDALRQLRGAGRGGPGEGAGRREARVNLATERAERRRRPGAGRARPSSPRPSRRPGTRRGGPSWRPGDGAESLRRERAEQRRLLAEPADRRRRPDGPAGRPRLRPAARPRLGHARRRRLGDVRRWRRALQVYLGGPYLRGAWERLQAGVVEHGHADRPRDVDGLRLQPRPAPRGRRRTRPTSSWTPGSS